MIERNQGGDNSPIEVRRIGVHKLETQLLPPERFKTEITSSGQPREAEVVDIDKIGETTAVVKKLVDGHFEAEFYDGKGNIARVNLDPSSVDLGRLKNLKEYIRLDGSSSNYSRDISLDFRDMGYSEAVAQKLKIRWSKLDKKSLTFDSEGDIRKADLLRSFPLFIPAGEGWQIDVREDSQGNKMFVATVEDTHFSIKPTAPFVKSSLSDREFQELKDSSVLLMNDLKLDKQTTIFRITDTNGKTLANYSGNEPTVDPSDPNFLYFLNAGQVYKLDLKGVVGRTSHPELVSELKIPDPQELHLDPHGNFVVARSKDNKLIIYEKDTGEEVRSFGNVKGPILIDEQGDITFADTENRLRAIQTNFQAIPPGEEAHSEERKAEALRELQQRFSNLDLDKVGRQKEGGISEGDVARTLRETISKQVAEKITASENPQDLEGVLDRLQGLKADPVNKPYSEVIDEFVQQARDRLSLIRTSQLDTQLNAYEKAIGEVKTVGDTIGLDEQFAKLLELRQKIDIADPQVRREIEQRLQGLQTRKDTLNTQYQGELVTVADQILPQIADIIKETGSFQELAYASTSGPIQQFEMMLTNIKDPQVRRELRDKYNAMKTEQRRELEERGRELKERDNQRYAQILAEAREDLTILREQIENLSDTRQLDRFDRDPLVTAWRAKLFALPPELREIEEKRLEIILGARKKDIEHRKELGAVGEAGELKFKDASFPVYKEPPRIWQPKLVARKTGFTNWADLVFEDSQGRIFKPGGETDIVVEGDLNSEQTKRMIENHRKAADEYFRGVKRKVPDFDEKWRITEFHMGKLEEIAEALNLQRDNHRGILLLQGEAGTGKNVLIDMLANLSNREVVSILCNENSVKEDLTYEFYYDPEKGTYKLPSRLIEGLQKPGAIILFDEINALKPGIAKMLNALFDYRRRIFLPEGGKERDILADPTVLFVGTMNPQNYGGVNRLSPEVKSRARVVDIEYPPFEIEGDRTRYRPDEAEMLANYMSTLGTLNQKEFRLCWDYVINRDTTNGAERILQGNPVLEADIRRVYDVVRVANRLREMYEAYQIGESNEPMDFPTSIREVVDIVLEMNHKRGVGNIIRRVIIPKIDDRRQKKIVEETINAVLGESSDMPSRPARPQR